MVTDDEMLVPLTDKLVLRQAQGTAPTQDDAGDRAQA
jgi:hypothetical protein